MKLSNLVASGLIFAASTMASANDIPDLQSSISELSASELSAFESSAGDIAITETFDVAVEVAIESGPDEIPAGLVPELSTDLVSQALSEGFISETEAADLTTVVEIFTANEKYFDFNFAETLSQAVANNGLTAAEAAFMLQSFDSLSEAGKNAVGASSFDFDANGADMTALGESDRRIICAVDCANNPY